MRKEIAVDAEMAPAKRTLIPAAPRRHPFPIRRHPFPLVAPRHAGKGAQAREARLAPVRARPRHLGPVHQREKVVV